jgi:hypothetical protein
MMAVCEVLPPLSLTTATTPERRNANRSSGPTSTPTAMAPLAVFDSDDSSGNPINTRRTRSAAESKSATRARK